MSSNLFNLNLPVSNFFVLRGWFAVSHLLSCHEFLLLFCFCCSIAKRAVVTYGPILCSGTRMFWRCYVWRNLRLVFFIYFIIRHNVWNEEYFYINCFALLASLFDPLIILHCMCMRITQVQAYANLHSHCRLLLWVLYKLESYDFSLTVTTAQTKFKPMAKAFFDLVILRL